MGDNFLGLTQEKSQILKSQLLRKKEQKWNILQISFLMLCYLMHSIIKTMFGWKICSKFNFTSIFLILANFATFLDHTKENADVSKNGGYFKVNFYIYRKYMPEAFSTSNLVALSITSKELGRGAFLPPPPTKIVLSNSPPTIGLRDCTIKILGVLSYHFPLIKLVVYYFHNFNLIVF